MTTKTRICIHCGKRKPLTDFYANENIRPCKPCRRAWERERQANLTPDQLRTQQMGWRRKALAKIIYEGRPMTIEDFDAELAKQKGRCALCGTPFARRPDADHDHDTGWFRGLLDRSCNIRLHKGADLEWYTLALRYLGSTV